MDGMDFTINSQADLIKAIERFGFLPYFRNSIEGFSIPTAIVLPFEGHARQSKLMHAQIQQGRCSYFGLSKNDLVSQ